MEPRIDPSPRLLLRASQQAGVISTTQAVSYGLGRHSVARLVDQGAWQRLASGLYLTSRERPTWLARAWGGVLLAGPGARLGGGAAAHLHDLLDEPPTDILVWTPARQCRDRGTWRFRRVGDDLRRRGGERPPVISVEDCVLDLCRGASEPQVVSLVTRAVQHRRTDPELLRRRLAERARVSHRRLLDDLLRDVADGSETPLELRYVRDVERAHRLPTGERQRRDRHTGHRRDVWYRAWRTAVELDGRLGHEGTGRFRDMRIDNLGVLHGTTTLRFGWHDVRGRPCDLALLVATVLRRNGWDGAIRTCPRCPRSL